jgi:serine/threonine protein phosphatase 1
MLLDARRSRKEREFWLGAGGQATLDSYGFVAGFKDIPRRHWRFIESCLPYFETETHFFVHANFVPELPLDQQPGKVLRWLSLADSIPGRHRSGKIAVLGHTPQENGEILDLGHLLCIDTNCVGGGWLTALVVGTERVWQGDDRGWMRK